jgi:hypothetical protein
VTLSVCTKITDYFGTITDFSAVVDRDASSVGKPNWSRTVTATLVLRMYVRDYLAGTYNVARMQEVWDGWVDEAGVWQEEDLFGGFVRKKSVKKQGGMIIVTLTLDSFDLLWHKVVVPGYPDNPFNMSGGGGRHFHIPPSEAAGDVPIFGVPQGYNAHAWLSFANFATGYDGLPIDGVVKRFLPNIDFGGVDSIFGSAGYFGVDSRPTNSTVRGYAELLYLGDMVDLIMSQFRLLFPTTRPGYYLKPIPDPGDATKVLPQLRAADLAAATTADWTFSDDPDDFAGGAFPYAEYEYSDDASDYYDWIAVAGGGSISAGLDATTHQQLIQRVWGLNHTYSGSIPNRFAVTGRGWQLLHRDNDITTQAQATDLATALADAGHLQRETATLIVWQPVQSGQIARVKHRATQGTASTGVNYPGAGRDAHNQRGPPCLSA